MKLSEFGKKFSRESGIVELMDDLGSALIDNPEMLFMGGGNPGRIPEVEAVFKRRLEALMATPEELHRLFGIYQSPQGDPEFRDEVAKLLKRELGWSVTAKNIAVSNGSQSAFHILFNMFAGTMEEGGHRSVHLPIAPEYLGYADVGLSESFFTATRPSIELLDNDLFKYRVDFDSLTTTEDIGALCVSRPTNPTGNVLTDAEIEQLDAIAKARDVPLIIDGAYGLPFPGIIFNDAKPHWNDNTIVVLSFSKLGLPGARTGIIVAREEIIQAYTTANTVVSIGCGTLGPAIGKQLFRSGEILTLSRDVISPFYKEKSSQALLWFRNALGDLPYRIHKPEGAIFLWLWFEGLPISSQELYERLKRRGVLVVPGHNFFVGIESVWRHRHECIRVSYAQDAETVKRGISIIADELRLIYSGDTALQTEC